MSIRTFMMLGIGLLAVPGCCLSQDKEFTPVETKWHTADMPYRSTDPLKYVLLNDLDKPSGSHITTRGKAEAIIAEAGKLIARYRAMPQNSWSDGNVAICIIDEEGNTYGKLYGNDKVKNRRTYDLAWKKASQVWITGMKTGEFEKKIFNGELKEGDYGIQAPDFIGWQGGQPIVLKDGTKLAVGFSGFSGESDLEIVLKAVEVLGF